MNWPPEHFKICEERTRGSLEAMPPWTQIPSEGARPLIGGEGPVEWKYQRLVAKLGWSEGVVVLKRHGFELAGESVLLPANVPPWHWVMRTPCYHSNPGVWFWSADAYSTRIPEGWTGQNANELRKELAQYEAEWTIEAAMCYELAPPH